MKDDVDHRRGAGGRSKWPLFGAAAAIVAAVAVFAVIMMAADYDVRDDAPIAASEDVTSGAPPLGNVPASQ